MSTETKLPMDVARAVELFWQAVGQSSLRQTAGAVPVGHTTAAGWKNGVVPEGKNRERLIAWAIRWEKNQPSPPDVLAEAVQRTGDNLVRLSKISGYAEAILDMMRGVTQQQERVVESLRPWVTHEADQEAIAETIRQNAAAHAQMPQTDTGSGRPSTARVGRRKAAPRDDDASEEASSDPEKGR